jgi:hypothetical protein
LAGPFPGEMSLRSVSRRERVESAIFEALALSGVAFLLAEDPA